MSEEKVKPLDGYCHSEWLIFVYKPSDNILFDFAGEEESDTEANLASSKGIVPSFFFLWSTADVFAFVRGRLGY